MKRISVIVPCYGDGAYLPALVRSCQHNDLLEIIVVDDGSEKPVEVPEGVKLIRIEHKGAAAARNAGMKEAKGDMLFFLDADSRVLPGAWDLMLKVLDDHPEHDFSYGKYYFEKKDGGIVFLNWEQTNRTMQWNPQLLKGVNYVSSMMMIRRCACPAWDEELLRFQDWDLALTLADQGKIGFGLNHFVVATAHRDGITTSQPNNVWQVHVQMKHFVPKVAIFMLMRDRAEYTKRTIEGLRRYAGYPFDLYGVDNGSDHLNKQPLKEFQGVYRSPVNLGLKLGCQKALGMIGHAHQAGIDTEYTHIMKLDNDCDFVQTQTLFKLLRACMLMQVQFNAPNIVVGPCVEGLNKPLIPEDTIMKDGFAYGVTRHLGGICCLSTAPHWLNFARVDYPCAVARGQDAAFSQFTEENQGRMFQIMNISVKHMDTTEGQRLKNPIYFERKEKEEKVQA